MTQDILSLRKTLETEKQATETTITKIRQAKSERRKYLKQPVHVKFKIQGIRGLNNVKEFDLSDLNTLRDHIWGLVLSPPVSEWITKLNQVLADSIRAKETSETSVTPEPKADAPKPIEKKDIGIIVKGKELPMKERGQFGEIAGDNARVFGEDIR